MADRIDLSPFAEPARSALRELLAVRLATNCDRMGPAHVLLSVLRSANEHLAALLKPGLTSERSAGDVIETLLEYCTGTEAQSSPPLRGGEQSSPPLRGGEQSSPPLRGGEQSSPPLRGGEARSATEWRATLPLLGVLRADAMTSEAAALVRELGRSFPVDSQPMPTLDAYRRLLGEVGRRLSEPDRGFLRHCLDLEAVIRPPAIRNEAAPTRAVFDDGGELLDGLLTADGRQLLDSALELAGRTGHPRCLLAHLVLACMDRGTGPIRTTLRTCGEGSRLRAARDGLFARLMRPPSRSGLLAIRDSFDDSFRIVLERITHRRLPADAVAVLLVLLENAGLDPGARDALVGPPLKLDEKAALAALHRALDDAPEVARTETTKTQIPQAAIPAGLDKFENLTALVANLPESRYVERPEKEELLRGLSASSTRWVLLHGQSGVGCSALVESVARTAAVGQVPFLTGHVFVRIDLAKMSEGSRAALAARAVVSGRGHGKLVIVLENLHTVVGEREFPLARLVADADGPRVIGVLRSAEYTNRVAADQDVSSHIYPVPLAEPNFDVTVAILHSVAASLKTERPDVEVVEGELTEIVQLANRFCTNWPRPKRATALLNLALDESDFLSKTKGGRPQVGRAATVKALERLTGQPIDSEADAEYYRKRLSQVVIGQPEAAALAADCILNARQGTKTSMKPAGIMLFAGQSGTGKTLMAEAIAGLVSTRPALKVFAMETFQEAHSIARFIGAPPGYVGYEQGGGLVNVLLENPNGVILFDEVEKAHPSVWNTCLGLFDRGVLMDAAAREARADRAYFVLTSNLCQEVVDDCLGKGMSLEKMKHETLAAIRVKVDKRTGQPYFSKELLNRFDGLVIFRPLDVDALTQIAHIEIAKVVQAEREDHSIRVVSDDGSWSALAAVLAQRALPDLKKGRAVMRAIKESITTPIAGHLRHFSRGGDRKVRVSVESRSGRPCVVLYGPDGTPFAEDGHAYR